MSAYAEVHVDLSDISVREFLCSRTQTTYQKNDDKEYMNIHDLERRSEYNDPGPPDQIDAFTMLRRVYSVRKDNSSIGNVSVIIPVKHKLELRLSGVLYVKRSITEVDKAKIESAFLSFDPGIHLDLEQYARDQNDALGIEASSYHIDFLFSLTKLPPPTLDESQENALRKQFDEQYSLVLNLEECLNYVSQPPQSDNIIDVPDINDAIDSIERKLEERAERSPCDDLLRSIERISQVFWYPEFKTETECKTVKAACFKRKRICWDVPYHRDANVILWATAMYKGSDVRFKTIIEHCLKESAIASIVIGIVTENFLAALAAFKLLFIECITEHTLEMLECLEPDLFLTTERSVWKRVW